MSSEHIIPPDCPDEHHPDDLDVFVRDGLGLGPDGDLLKQVGEVWGHDLQPVRRLIAMAAIYGGPLPHNDGELPFDLATLLFSGGVVPFDEAQGIVLRVRETQMTA